MVHRSRYIEAIRTYTHKRFELLRRTVWQRGANIDLNHRGIRPFEFAERRTLQFYGTFLNAMRRGGVLCIYSARGTISIYSTVRRDRRISGPPSKVRADRAFKVTVGLSASDHGPFTSRV